MGIWEIVLIPLQLTLLLGVPIAVILCGVLAYRRIVGKLDTIEKELRSLRRQLQNDGLGEGT